MRSPRIVFGDEPTGALNSTAAAGVMDLLEGVNADGVTLLLVTHDPRVAARADRVLFMSDGVIVDQLVIGPDPMTMETRQNAVSYSMRALGV